MTKQMRRVLKRLTISIVLATTLAMSVPNFEPASKAFAADTVCVPATELHDLYAGVDSLLMERRLLQIDLWEAKRGAHVDSVLFAERLALRDAEKESWLVRALKSSAMDAVYFVAGVYLGAQVITHVR